MRTRCTRAAARTGVAVVALLLGAGLLPATGSSATAAPAPATAAIDTTHWTIDSKALRARLDAYLGRRHARAAIAVDDLTTGQTFAVHHALVFHTASIAKVDILAVLLLQHQRAHRPLSDEDRELATRMIEHSDNAAATALWARIGRRDGLTRGNKRLGLVSTVSDTTGGWGLTTTTAPDQARLLRAVTSSHSVLHRAARHYALHLMAKVEADQEWGVPAAADAGSTVHVKNGWLPYSRDGGRWITNSVGVVHVHGHLLCLSVLASGSASMGTGITTVEHAAGLVRAALSASEAVPPRYVVTAKASPTTVAAGATVAVSGHVGPNAHGRTVRVQEHVGTRWRTVATATVTKASTYRATVAGSTKAGRRSLRVYVAADRTHRSGTSGTLHVAVGASTT